MAVKLVGPGSMGSTLSLLAVWETIALGILLLFWICYKFNRNNSKLVLPPGPRPWPVVGNLHQLGKLPHHSLADLAKKYGPIMFLRFGSSPTVVVSSPEMAREFLKTHDLVFANRPKSSAGKFMGYDHTDVLFSNYGAHWQQMRKLCALELLSAKRVESFKWVREEEVLSMIHSIWVQSGRGLRCVELGQSFSSLTQNIVCRMFAGRTFADHELSGGKGFKEMINEAFALGAVFCAGDVIPYLNWLDWQGIHRRMKKVHRIFDEFAEEVISEHERRRKFSKEEEEQDRVKDFVDVLLDMAETQTETKITRVDIKAIILNTLSGGTETSTTTMEWAMCELLRNPCALAKAREEIESVVGRHRIVKESDVAQCEYLRCCVKETFRLHAAAPLLVPHESSEACIVNGYHIPPKTRLYVNLWAMGRDETIWEDPCEFKPERFIGKEVDVKGQHFELLPFGTGRRGCPGTLMGLAVLQLTLAQLLHCFHWSVEGEVNMEEVGLMTRKFPLSARPKWRLTTDLDHATVPKRS